MSRIAQQVITNCFIKNDYTFILSNSTCYLRTINAPLIMKSFIIFRFPLNPMQIKKKTNLTHHKKSHSIGSLFVNTERFKPSTVPIKIRIPIQLRLQPNLNLLQNKKATRLEWLFVNAEGFEPSTACLEGRCSIQLSYASIFIKLPTKFLSGWQDSNLRPPAPKAGAITGLRYTPRQNLSGETGTRTLATVTRRQISNLLHYRSGTSPSSRNVFCFAVANVRQHSISHNYFGAFF